MRRMLFGGMTLLVGCSWLSDGPTASRSTPKTPDVALTVADGTPCSIWMPDPLGRYSNGWLTYAVGENTNVSCGIRWSMTQGGVATGATAGMWWRGTLTGTVANPTPTDTFYVTPYWGQGQVGPNVVTFSASVDRVTTTITAQASISEQITVLPQTQRIIAYDSAGRVLLDTAGGLNSTIARPGIRTVEIYPVPDPASPASSLMRKYVMAFRPDSTCPPSGDPVVDSKPVREELRKAMNESLASGGIENGIYIWKMLDGTFKPVRAFDPSATPCGINMPLTGLTPPPGADGSKPWAVAHTHPHSPGDIVPASCKLKLPATFEPDQGGGGSDRDWYYARLQTMSVYALTKAGTLYRLDFTAPPGASLTNANQWKTDAKQCFVK